jgi:FKBP-type peptidyl-prolyl cis-trans isomerase FkpA
MTTKTPTPDVRSKLPSPPAMAAIAGSALCLALTIWIFMPYGFLDSLTAPQEIEASDLLIKEQESEMSADLSPEKNAAYLADNAKKDGVDTTKTGLQFRSLSGGGGKKPGPRSQVTVHYTGALINGKVFDSSVKRGEPITFGLNQVIPGWTEGLQLMSEGEKAELVIPQDIGYGARGAPGAIPPYQTLVFQVELIKVED